MNRKHNTGFTLIETLLVLVIISMIIYAGLRFTQQRSLQMRLDRTSTQMQQILNAGLSFYVMNGKWPADLAALQGNYLPPASVALRNPWGQEYTVVPVTSTTPPGQSLLYVYTQITVVATQGAFAAATAIAGTLPLAYTSSKLTDGIPDASTPCQPTNTTCYIAASVNIPGQNLNNATSVNFAGLYHHGGCVPIPTCPVDTDNTPMKPEIYVAPVQVSGKNDSDEKVYPISSFTAYAIAPAGNDSSPGRCPGDQYGDALCTGAATGTGSPTNRYWRVCVKIITEKGEVGNPTSPAWGLYQTLLAVTRCVISGEKAGSGFDVFTY